jgi:hypothetical protein
MLTIATVATGVERSQVGDVGVTGRYSNRQIAQLAKKLLEVELATQKRGDRPAI